MQFSPLYNDKLPRIDVYAVEIYGFAIDAFKDRNVCTVVALACVTGNTYGQSFRYMEKHGRVKGRGMIAKKIHNAFKGIKKFKIVKGPYTEQNRITVSQFIKKHPVGRFYVCNRNHAFCIIDGVLHDHTDGPRRQITMAYRVYREQDLRRNDGYRR